MKKSFLFEVRKNLPSALVVYLVALPLCLGIGLASTSIPGMSGMPNLFAGVISGIIGGVLVGAFSGSRLGVSGPAAGLITIVTASIVTLGSYQAFLVAVFLAGVIQFVGGVFNAGSISNYFPSSVIKGMLAGIGITLIVKEIPHLLGWDADPIGDEVFSQLDGQTTLSELSEMLSYITVGTTLIGISSLLVLLLFEAKFIKKRVFAQYVPGALVAVATGILLSILFRAFSPNLLPEKEHFVNIPVAEKVSDFFTFFSFPDFSALLNPSVYVIAFTIAIVASLETLLSVEATDKLDPKKQLTPTNKELKAQGVGNMFSGLIGGLPITQVIVRSSTNISAGATSRLSAILHGVILLLSIVIIPSALNYIPLASLAAILLFIGYKLASMKLFRSMYDLGWEQFLPFAVTVAGVFFTDLLRGIIIGMAVSLFFLLRKNFKNSVQHIKAEGEEHRLVLSEETTFLNKGSLSNILFQLKANSSVVIDGSKCVHIDYDVLELITHFKLHKAKELNISVRTINILEVHPSGTH